MKGHLLKRNFIFSFLILLIGFGGLLGYDLYFKPYVLSEKVVKIKVTKGSILPKNYVLTQNDLYMDSVQTKDVPENSVTKISDVENKILNVNVTNGLILTDSLVDINELEPKDNEGIFPIRKEDIYAINGSLRARDKVDLYLVYSEEQRRKTQSTPTTGLEAESKIDLKLPEKSFLSNISVNYVRTDDNNDVRDTAEGKTTNRVTSTGKIAAPELLLSNDQGSELKAYLEKGYKLWIVRVD
ncbi:hypothetical protein [Paenibacillus sp. FSL L8-0463]|uniref:hypothetical protein n=1 Tax=Paenibacillus sp. FSL L8-0463 TaxID=2954687 RepID=UPI00311921B7